MVLGLAVLQTWVAVWAHVSLVAISAGFWFTLACFALVLLPRTLTPRLARGLLVCFLAVASVYAVVMLIQALSGSLSTGLSMGSPRYAGALVATAIPIAPVLLWPLLGVGVIVSESYLALVAALTGLAVRYRRCRGIWWILAGLAVLGVVLIVLLRAGPHGPVTPIYSTRWLAYQVAWAQVLEAPWFGLGPGGWLSYIPYRQHLAGHVDLFLVPHSEPVGVLVEYGLVGVALLAAWLALAAPILWRSNARPALVTISILALGLHVFRVAALGPWLLVVIALGLWGGRHEPAHA